MDKLNIQGDWNIKKNKLQQNFAELSDEDLNYTQGQEEQLIGRIQQRLGVPREIAIKIIRYS